MSDLTGRGAGLSREAGETFPLSFAQRRLWFLEQLAPGQAIYTVPHGYRLTGRLDAGALERSLGAIVERHESLRTTFRAPFGEPQQVIEPGATFALPLRDLSGLARSQREARAMALINEDCRRPFDLECGPLMRAMLVRLSEDDHILFLNLHHIIADGWSMGVLGAELAALYAAFVSGRPPALPEPPVQYVDYAHWQRQWLVGDTLERQLDYWRRHLAGALPVLELPCDRPRPAEQTFRGATRTRPLNGEVVAGLAQLAKKSGATLFMALLAGYAALLGRWTGQRDVIVGTPVANRTRAELERLIGFFVNTLPVRCDLSGDPGFDELLARVRAASLDGYANQDVPFEMLVEALQPARDLKFMPVFQTMMSLENLPSRLELLGVEAADLSLHNGGAKCDLTVFVRERPTGWVATAEYRADLHEAATVDRLLGHYENLLASAAADPGRRLSELELMSRAERHQVLVEWNDSRRDYPRESCIHELFAAQARATPDEVAVRCGGDALSYAGLDRRAGRLAGRLRRLGVGPDVMVGVCLERSLEMVVAVLAVLKAGGAYVPLDPAFPAPRLRFMLDDTAAPVALSVRHLAPRLPESAARIVCLDDGGSDDRGDGATAAAPACGPDNLAYVIYTSGSTGRPKGVCVTHRNVVRLVKGADYADLGPGEVFLQGAPLAFDASTFEIWGPLLNGGRLVVMAPGTPSLHDLGGALVEGGVTTMFLTTALFNLMVAEWLDDLGNVRRLLAGGEVMSIPHVRKALAGRPRYGMSAVYGPTETTTFASHCPMLGDVPAATSVPIGRPISNTSMYVLDWRLNPVPVGVAGEIYIGGDGVARGYLNRPELTAERFVPDPFGPEAGARLYRTGDRGRFLADGNVEFVGRVDYQVKIRGFRIEPEEVELALNQHPAVREAVVTAREDAPGDRRLVAYVVPRAGQPPSIVHELRGFLQGRLPDYMVPAAFLALDAFPLTLNGKVDRSALPAPAAADAEGEGFVPPEGAVEEALAAIWSDLLGVARVGRHDDFFSLGGHSLKGIQLISRVRDAFGLELTVRALFERPTLSGLAREIAAAGEDQSPSRRVAR